MKQHHLSRPRHLLAGLAVAAVATASCGDAGGDSDADEGLARVQQEQEHDGAEVPVRQMEREQEQGGLPGEVVAAMKMGERPGSTVYDPPPDLALRVQPRPDSAPDTARADTTRLIPR